MWKFIMRWYNLKLYIFLNNLLYTDNFYLNIITFWNFLKLMHRVTILQERFYGKNMHSFNFSVLTSHPSLSHSFHRCPRKASAWRCEMKLIMRTSQQVGVGVFNLLPLPRCSSSLFLSLCSSLFLLKEAPASENEVRYLGPYSVHVWKILKF